MKLEIAIPETQIWVKMKVGVSGRERVQGIIKAKAIRLLKLSVGAQHLLSSWAPQSALGSTECF